MARSKSAPKSYRMRNRKERKKKKGVKKKAWTCYQIRRTRKLR